MTPEQESELGRCLFREARDAYFVVRPADQVILDANPTALRLTGLRRKQLQKLSLSELLDADTETGLADLLKVCRSTSTLEAANGYFLRCGGQRRPVELTATRLQPEPDLLALLIVRDITPKHELEGRPRRSDAWFRELAEQVRVIPWEGDATTWTVTYIGPQIVRLLGYRLDAWKTPGFWIDHLHPDDREITVRRVADLTQQGEDHVLEFRMLAADGRTVWLHSIIQVLREPGRAPGLRGFMIDVTEQRRLEEELRQAQKMESIGRLAAGVAHDLNNRLTVILGYSSLLLGESQPPPNWRSCLEELQRSSQQAATFVSHLLAFSRKQVLQPKVSDLNEVVRRVEQSYRGVLGEKVQTTLELEPRLWSVKADPRFLEQVLLQLLANARDAMPPRGQLHLSTANVLLDADRVRHLTEVQPGRYVELAVRDNGIGMDSTTLAHIFEPFFTTKPAGSGRGLGLASAHGIIRQSGGTIQAQSAVGHGSTFTIYLPALEMAVVPADAPVSTGLTKSALILLVEDDASVLALASNVLQQHGYQIRTAASGDSALELAVRAVNGIDLLVTDVVMPGMSGPRLYEELSRTRPHLRVLFMSGYPGDELTKRGMRLAAGKLLQKPFTPQALADAVSETLGANTTSQVG